MKWECARCGRPLKTPFASKANGWAVGRACWFARIREMSASAPVQHLPPLRDSVQSAGHEVTPEPPK